MGEDLDARSDIYACGVMLYEMATGRPPFETHDKEAMTAFHLNMDPRAPSRIHPIDPRFESLILKALRKDRTVRYQSARELRLALRALVAPPAEVQSPPPSPASPVGGRPKSAPPPPPMAGTKVERPDWVEGNVGLGAMDPAQLQADRLVKDHVRWLADLAATTDPSDFATRCSELEAALPHIARSARLDVMWRIRSTLAVIVDEGPATQGSRPSGAHRVLKALQDPSVLAPAAHDLLHGHPPSRQASGLLLAAGVGGAYVLYSARTKSAPDNREVRSRFTAVMREIGTQAFPVLRAALEKLSGREEDAPALLVDVLEAIPPIVDDATGEVVSRFLTCRAPEIRRVVTSALVRCWGERGQALLVGLLKDEDESVRIAAIAGIRKIGRVDETVVRRLGAMLQPSHRMSTALKTEAAIAYRSAAVAGRPTAIAILTRLVAAAPASGPSEEGLLVEEARSLLSLGARDGAAVVSERASRQREPLRGRLLDLRDEVGDGWWRPRETRSASATGGSSSSSSTSSSSRRCSSSRSASLLMFLGEARINVLFGILTVSFVAVVVTGIVLVLVFVRREANLSELQADFVSKVSHELRTPLTASASSPRRSSAPRGDEDGATSASTRSAARPSGSRSASSGCSTGGAWRRGASCSTPARDASARSSTRRWRRSRRCATRRPTLEFAVEVDAGPADGAGRSRTPWSTRSATCSRTRLKYGGTPPVVTLARGHGARRPGRHRGDATTATGIPRGEHRRIFDKFYRIDDRLSREREGSGLGPGNREAHRARAPRPRAASTARPGKGSTFRIVLPRRCPSTEARSRCAQAPRRRSAHDDEPAHRARRRSARVLVVEDDASIALGLRINLEAEGYGVLSAEDGESRRSSSRASEQPGPRSSST